MGIIHNISRHLLIAECLVVKNGLLLFFDDDRMGGCFSRLLLSDTQVVHIQIKN
jgi:hypothetical protein